MAEKALEKSEDVTELKKFRGAIKSQITNNVNKLNELFAQKVADDFDHKTINQDEVNQVEAKLRRNFDLFLKLDQKCCDFREEGADATEEIELVQKDAEYSEEVTSKVYPLFRQLKAYYQSVAEDEAKKANEKTKQNTVNNIPAFEKKFEDSLAVFKVSKKNAQQVAQCLNNLKSDEICEAAIVQVQPAESTKEELKKYFDEVIANANELKDALQTRGDDADSIKEKVKFDRLEEIEKIGNINIDLDKIVNVQKLNSSKNTTSSPILSSTFKESETGSGTPIKLNKPDPLKFSGQSRDFASFKNKFETIIVPNRSAVDIGVHLLQAIPAKHQHLVANVKIENYQEMMKILADEFGTVEQIIDSVVSEIERIKLVNSDKAFVEFVEKLERIHRDLKTVDMLREVANASNISKLESKLPSVVSQEWTKTVINEDLTGKGSDTKFDKFMEFLAKYKKMVKYQMSDARSSVSHKTQTQTCFVTGLSAKVKPKGDYKESSDKIDKPKFEMKPCIACNDGATNIDSIKHSVESCDVWNSLTVKEKEAKVKCKKHPFSFDHNHSDCKSNIRGCKICKEKTHHFLLCPKRKVRTSSAKSTINTTSRVSASLKTPVIVQALLVKTMDGNFGTLLDNCSTDNYITNAMAEKYQLTGEDVELVVEGIGGETNKVDSKIFQVPIKDKFGQEHVIECYGMDVIATPTKAPEKDSYSELCERFGISPKTVKRPQKIDLLISMRDNHLHADTKLKTIGKMALYEGLLGKVFGGLDPDLKFGQEFKMSFRSTRETIPKVCVKTLRAALTGTSDPVVITQAHTAKTDKEIFEFFKQENIGAECSPKCGNCRCGKCPPGGKQMSLKYEKDYNMFTNHMRYDKEGTASDPGPYWRVKFPWVVPKDGLVFNKSAVLGVMMLLPKNLERTPLGERFMRHS